MKDNELIEILKEFDEKRVGQLNDNARNLFNAIMDIANQRDRLLEEKQELIDYLKNNIKITCDFSEDTDEDDVYMFYLGKTRAYQQVLSKIEKE